MAARALLFTSSSSISLNIHQPTYQQLIYQALAVNTILHHPESTHYPVVPPPDRHQNIALRALTEAISLLPLLVIAVQE